MSKLPATQTPQAPDESARDTTRLRGPWRLVVLGAWLVIFAVTLVSAVTQIPDSFAYFEHACPLNTGNCFFTPGAADALASLGISMHDYALAIVALYGFRLLISAILALFLIWRRSNDWLALVVALVLLSVVMSGLQSGAPSNASWLALLEFFGTLPARLVYYVIFLIFPSGRFVPRWSWVLLIAWLAVIVVETFATGPLGDIFVLGYPILYGSAIASQFYRYRVVSTPMQRRQTKWIVFGFIISLLANQAFWLPSGLTPLGDAIYLPISYAVYMLVLLLVPISFYIAMQRHQLFDIDVIINRTLVYGSLTAILAAIYAGGIIGLQAAFHALTGQDSPLTIVLSTLLIAALFQPLRARLQRVIDRRFYRTKYDAQKTLAAFSAGLRGEVDLAMVRDQVVGVVRDTMHPAHVSLWLRDPNDDSARGGHAATPPMRAGREGVRPS